MNDLSYAALGDMDLSYAALGDMIGQAQRRIQWGIEEDEIDMLIS